MKLCNLMPIMGDIMTPEMMDYMAKYVGPDTVVEARQITQGPYTIECEYDEAVAAPEVVKVAVQAEQDGFDGIFVNCFGDPGVRAARECVDIPVFGGFEPIVHIGLGLADRLGVVTVLDNVIPMIHGNIARAGLQDRIVSVRNVGIPVADLSDHSKTCEAVYGQCLEAIRQEGVQAIVLGCTGFVDVAETVQNKLHAAGYPIPVLEAAQCALMMLELHAKMGLRHSRRTYMPPPEK